MAGSRTIKILVALVIAMTIGAIALKLMETSPAPLTIADMMAMINPQLDVKTYPNVPLKTEQWRSIVIHSTGPESADITSRVHFVIDADGTSQLVHPTEHWRQQMPSQHMGTPAVRFNSTSSIGICLKGDFSKQPPTRAQFDALVNLVCTLQQMCHISAQNVYSYCPDLSAGTNSPGVQFPMKRFQESLLN